MPSGTPPSTVDLLAVLERKASQLSTASDDLNHAFEAIQKRLTASGLGLEAWVTIDTTRAWSDESELQQRRIWDEDQLGYARFGDGWSLLARTAHFEETDEGEDWEYGEAKPLVRAARKTRVEAVRALPKLLMELERQADGLLELVAQAKQLASPPGADCMWCRVEATSARRLAYGAPRECPACNHVFQGRGWDGVDAHWRAEHEKALNIPYDDFWRGIMGCVRHWSVGVSGAR